VDVTPIIDSLNDAQRQAVTSDNKHLLILAGAGSGKTRVLVHRMAWLIDVQGQSPQSLLAVTFTNKAAREMRGRIENMLGIPTRSMWVGTFHGLAHRLLNQHWSEAGLQQNFQILDSDDQQRLVKRVIRDIGLDENRWPGRQAQWFINGQKDEGIRAKFVEDSDDPFLKTHKKIYLAYEEVCKANSLVDFGELLLRAHELLRDDEKLLKHYQERFTNILVDEFQDTNTIQYAWLRLLAGKKGSMMVVGDDDQSIYGWRGAKIENIQDFSRTYPKAETVRLEQNYRSTDTILKAANAVISRNTGRLGKNLWTAEEGGDLISLYSAFNEVDEARFIAEYLKRRFEQGNNYSESAVLYRSNAQSRVLEEAMLRAKIPYRIYGGQRFYERLEIKNALGYLRLCLNRDDDQSFERVVNTPTRGIGNRTLEDVRTLAREQGISLWQSSLKLIDEKLMSGRATNALYAFVELVISLEESIKDKELSDMAEQAINSTGLLEFHRAEKGEKGEARVENLMELVGACKAYEADDPDMDVLPQFLAQATLEAGDQQAEEHEDALQMMTFHSSKGLEFPLVVMAGMEENLFPHSMSSEEHGRLEEERRLAYVGITRAEKKVVMTYAECRRIYGEERFNAVSRFVRDVPGELVEEVRAKVKRPAKPGTVRATGGSSRKFSTSDKGVDTGFELGQHVSHPKFGEGVILTFEGHGANARVQVNFNSEGSKWLVVSYARLEAI
jgi:DNA helicase-2/ATP-dependent DNA helicase PcrA|tara:strand:+ start:90700 stop:92880 length:2181 start_codon:yes stop_codon:yes gene_type:complete